MEIKSVCNEILEQKFTHEYRSGYVTIDGFVFPETMTKVLSEIEDLEVYDSDIWVTSYPKSGTTWTQEMVWLIANDLDFENALKLELDKRCPFLEFSGLYKPTGYKNTVEEVIQMQHPRFIKTHLPWSLLPKQIKDGRRKPKIIHVVRNPKDTCVSYYHHVRLLEGFKGNFEEFCELFLSDEVNYSPYWKNVGSYWTHNDQENLLFVKYEDMKNDLSAVVREVAKFLKKSCSEDDVKRLCDHLSFDKMKSNPAVNKEASVQRRKDMKISIDGDSFMRSGKVGDYKSLMNELLVKRFDDWTNKNMSDSITYIKN